MGLSGRAATALLMLVGIALAAGCGGSASAPSGPVGRSGGTCRYAAGGQPAKSVRAPSTTGVATTGTERARLRTNQGDVSLTLNRGLAPCTVNSFDSLVRQGYFDHTPCHRLTTSGIFVLQCGDPTGSGSGGPGYSFGNETRGHESYVAGVVAMANAGPDTNGSQFFLVYADSTALDQKPDYTIFATMDRPSTSVVAKIAAAGEDDSNGAGDGKPDKPVTILRATVS